MLLEINYTKYQDQLSLKKENNKTFLYDPIRKKFLVLQPEELVRQLVLQYLMDDRGFNKNFIRTEMGLRVNELYKRTDILIYDKDYSPFLLVECKSAKVKISQDTFDQIARYNLPLQVPYLLVTNGIHSYCCEMDYEKSNYHFLEEIPFAKNR